MINAEPVGLAGKGSGILSWYIGEYRGWRDPHVIGRCLGELQGKIQDLYRKKLLMLRVLSP